MMARPSALGSVAWQLSFPFSERERKKKAKEDKKKKSSLKKPNSVPEKKKENQSVLEAKRNEKCRGFKRNKMRPPLNWMGGFSNESKVDR